MLKKVLLMYVVFLFISGFLMTSCATFFGDGGKKSLDTPAVEKLIAPDKPILLEKPVARGVIPPLEDHTSMPYFVQEGDSLWKIAKKIYGKGMNWKELAAYNHILKSERLHTGDVLYYELNLKTNSFAKSYEAMPQHQVIVKSGDTLSSLAKVIYGTQTSWRELWKLNMVQVHNPNLIHAGQVLFFRSIYESASVWK